MLRGRWVAVMAAITFIAIVEALTDTVLDGVLSFPFDTILVVITVMVVGLGAAALLFRRIDRLTRALVERNAELESRNDALRAVYSVSLAVSAQAEPSQTIGSIARHARRLLRADAALVALQGREGDLHLVASDAAPGALVETAAPGAVLGPADLGGLLRPGVAVRLEAPIRQGGRPVGRLVVASGEGFAVAPAGPETLSALATQAGIALEALRLQEELQVLAVQGERERIAREMHDGLAQVLGYVNTKTQAIEGLLEDGRTDEARRQLAQLAEAARSVYVDVREAILNLSTPVPPDRGLAAALEDYASHYAESSKLAVRFEATPDAVDAPLSAAVQTEVFRIAGEALTNVRKHARAQRVSIRLARVDGEVVLTVKDDGRGFELEGVGSGPENWPHFGLAGMRERAASVGGAIEWHTSPGSGTEVELHVPATHETAFWETATGQTAARLEPSPDAPDDTQDHGPDQPAEPSALGPTSEAH